MATTVGDIEVRARKTVGDTQSSVTLTAAGVEAKVREIVGDTRTNVSLTAAIIEARVREAVGDTQSSVTLTAAGVEAKVREIVGDVRASATLTASIIEARVREAVGDTQSSATLTAAGVEAKVREIVGDVRASATLTAADVVSKAREIVNDRTAEMYRFSDELLLQYVWDGIRELGNLRPLYGTIAGSGAGTLPIDDRWGGCLEYYVASRAYQIDDSDTVNAKLASDYLALFAALAKQTPYAAPQATMVGYIWEGVRELGNIRPLGVDTIAATIATGLSTSATGSLAIDDRWGGCLQHYAVSRYYQSDTGNPEADNLATHHFKMFDALARQTPYHCSSTAMLKTVWEGIRELCNVRPIVGTTLGATIATGISTAATGSIVIDDRWGGCLEHYVAFKYYNADTGRPDSDKNAADHLALFLALAKQTPYYVTQTALVGYIWEGVRELGNIRPLGVDTIAATIATGLSTSATGSLAIDDRWGGCLQHYAVSRYYQSDTGNPEADNLATHHFKMFDALARQTPYHLGQQDMLGYVWEGIEQLWSVRPESRYVGLSLFFGVPPAAGSFSSSDTMPTDGRWHNAVVEYVCFKYYQRDQSNASNAKLADKHMTLFMELSAR
jgi:hypothetical protein